MKKVMFRFLDELLYMCTCRSTHYYMTVVIGSHRVMALPCYAAFHSRYDLWNNEWTRMSPMNTPRAWPACVVFDNKIYAIGGYNGTNRLRSVEVYDPETDRWTYMNNMATCRAGCAAAVV